MVVLFPGIMLGYAADALDVGNQLSRWYGAPFFALVVLMNAGCWNLVMLLIQRRRRPPDGQHLS